MALKNVMFAHIGCLHTLTLALTIKLSPSVAFSFSSMLVHGRCWSLAAYINSDMEPVSGGRDSFRNHTMNGESDMASANGKGIEIEGRDVDIVGAGTLGDIMAESALTDGTNRPPNNADTNPSQTAVIDGLVTKEGGELNKKFGCSFTPMERIALTANGNLQRIFSSYYDAPIHVHVDSCTRRASVSAQAMNAIPSLERFSYRITSNGAVWDRVVHLHVYEQTLCKATSVIHVTSPECIELIEKGTVGLGQLFRYLNKLPTFKLLDAGRTDLTDMGMEQSKFHGGIWRTYELHCEEMTCLIHEEFHCDAWNIFPNDNADLPFTPML